MSKWWKKRVTGLRPTICFVSDAPLGRPDGHHILAIIVGYKKGGSHPFIDLDGTVWAYAEPLGSEYFAGENDE